MARSQVTGASILPSFPQTLDGERILRETATANGPTVLPRQYFGLTAMTLFELVASVVRSKVVNGCDPSGRAPIRRSRRPDARAVPRHCPRLGVRPRADAAAYGFKVHCGKEERVVARSLWATSARSRHWQKRIVLPVERRDRP